MSRDIQEYADQCTDEPRTDREPLPCIECVIEPAAHKSGRCDGCELVVLEDALLALRKLHDPEDLGVADHREDISAIRAAIEPLDRKKEQRRFWMRLNAELEQRTAAVRGAA